MGKTQDRQALAAAKEAKMRDELARGAAAVRWTERFAAAEAKEAERLAELRASSASGND